MVTTTTTKEDKVRFTIAEGIEALVAIVNHLVAPASLMVNLFPFLIITSSFVLVIIFHASFMFSVIGSIGIALQKFHSWIDKFKLFSIANFVAEYVTLFSNCNTEFRDLIRNFFSLRYLTMAGRYFYNNL